MKIRTQLVAGIVIFAILLVIISGFIISSNQQLDEIMVQEDLANTIALETGELGYLANDYILYREPQQLERWNAKYAEVSGEIAQLSVVRPEQQVIAAGLAANLKNTRAVFDDIASNPVQPGGSGTAFVQLSWSRMAVQNQGMIFDAGRLARLLRDEETVLRTERTLFIFALMGIFVVFLLATYVLFYRRTMRSIGSLQEGSRIIGSGDFTHTIDETADDEVSDLARSFNRMTANLKAVTATKADLEREVAARRVAEEDLVRANEVLGRSETDLIQKNIELNALNEELMATEEELQQNIDELTRSDREVREANKRLETLYAAMNEGLAIHDMVYTGGEATDYVIRDVNPAYENITGIKKADAINRRGSDLYGIDKPPFLDIYARVAGGKGPEWFETYFPPMKKYFEISVFSPAKGTFATVFTDITERKRAGEALQEAHRRTATILRGIADTFYSLDSQWRFTTVNPAAEKAPFGRPATELLGNVIWDLYPALVGSRIHQHYLDAAKNHSMEHYEAQSPLNKRWYEVFMQGRDGGLDVYMRDITDRKLAEEELNTTFQRFYQILSGMSYGVLLLTDSNRVEYANQAFCDMFSIKDEPASLSGLSAGEMLKKIRPAYGDPYAALARIGDIIRQGQPVTGEEVGMSDGRTLLRDFTPLRMGEKIFGRLWIHLDISRRKQAEAFQRESEALAQERSEELSLVMDSVPAAVWIAHDPQALHVTGNVLSDEWLRIPHGAEASLSAPKGTRPQTFRVFKDGRELPSSAMPVQQSAGGIEVRNYELDLVYPDGTIRNILGNSTPLRDAEGNPRGSVSSFIDITDRREKEDILRLTAEVYRVSSDQSDLRRLLREYTRLLQHFSGCDSVGIRLMDEEGNIPYHANIGFSEDFYHRESPLSIKSHSCMCINVITGTTDPALPFYTEGGSFFINATTKFLATVSDEDRGKTRNVCNQAGYESVALIPVRRGETILGLLHLADHREGMVPVRMVRILETVAFAMGSQIMRLRVEESLLETSQYLESLITYANAPIIVWDPAFTITRFNRAFEELTGLSAGDAVGQPLSILFPEKFRAPSMEVIRRTMQGERLNVVEIPILRKDGNARIVLWNSATLFGPDGTTIVSTIAQGQDITDRKIAEAENIRARAEWEQTFNTVPDLIAILDPHHRIVRVNKAMADRLGTTPDQCIGKRCHEAVHGTSVPPEFCPHSKTCIDGKQHIAEVHEPGLGGTFIVSTTPLCDPAGTLLGTVHVAHDITDRKRAEEELRHQHRDLSAAYEKITATQEELQQNLEELSSRESQLQEALVEKEILLSEIHHRVKNNLTAFISLLSLEGSYEDTESGRALKKDLQNRARSMALIHETLYKTRKFSNVEMETYLGTLVAQIAGSYAGHEAVRIIVDAPGASLDLGRATTAGLIINELVTNSFKYAFPPEFDCRVERGEPCTIRITLADEDGTWVLTVADNGRGLPGGLDPLSTKSLGLKLVNFLARHQLRAGIEVRSDRGTAFIFRLENTGESG